MFSRTMTTRSISSYYDSLAPFGLSPQTDGMPVILKKGRLSKSDKRPVGNELVIQFY